MTTSNDSADGSNASHCSSASQIGHLGRVSDEDWETLKAAAAKRGETFTAWALAVLLRAAKRELGK
jgi:uncharacterized protein (DUF1778 family)